MKRREFIALLAGAATGPFSAQAQQTAMPVVGFLSSGSAAGLAPFVSAFLDGLKEAGFIDGHNVTIEYRWAEGQNDRLPALATDLARRDVAVIFASGGDAPRSQPRARATEFRSFLSVLAILLGLVLSQASTDPVAMSAE
jgi:putative tryptophan/tyrosine transport system substrate-binding protein